MNQRSLSNRTRQSFGKGKYRGVYWYAKTGKWRAAIKIDGKHKHLGYFHSEQHALDAVNEAYIKHFPGMPELYQASKEQEEININKIICGKW